MDYIYLLVQVYKTLDWAEEQKCAIFQGKKSPLTGRKYTFPTIPTVANFDDFLTHLASNKFENIGGNSVKTHNIS